MCDPFRVVVVAVGRIRWRRCACHRLLSSRLSRAGFQPAGFAVALRKTRTALKADVFDWPEDMAATEAAKAPTGSCATRSNALSGDSGAPVRRKAGYQGSQSWSDNNDRCRSVIAYPFGMSSADNHLWTSRRWHPAGISRPPPIRRG